MSDFIIKDGLDVAPIIETATTSVLQGKNSTVQVGMILPFIGTTIPDGWLLCNGASFNTSDYPKLANILGSSNLPDLQDRYLRASSTSANIGVQAGSNNHSHSPEALGWLSSETGTPTHNYNTAYSVDSGNNTANHGHTTYWYSATGPGNAGPYVNYNNGNQANINLTNHVHAASGTVGINGAGDTHSHTFTSQASGQVNENNHSHYGTTTAYFNDAQTLVPTIVVNYIVKAD